MLSLPLTAAHLRTSVKRTRLPNKRLSQVRIDRTSRELSRYTRHRAAMVGERWGDSFSTGSSKGRLSRDRQTSAKLMSLAASISLRTFCRALIGTEHEIVDRDPSET